MDQLIEGVLAIGARLSPIDGASVAGNGRSIQPDVLAIALHRQLLQIGGESLQVLLVRQHSGRLRAEKIVVPDSEQAHEYWKIAPERSCPEMRVHLMEAIQHGAEVIRANGQH